jgi:predicted transcriptional regulator
MDHKTDITVTKEGSAMQMQENEIVLYQPNDAVHLEVRMANESVWLTQSQIALLFGVGQPAISKHLNNIFKSGELDEGSVHSILEYTAADGMSAQIYMRRLSRQLSLHLKRHNAQHTGSHKRIYVILNYLHTYFFSCIVRKKIVFLQIRINFVTFFK